MPTNSMKSACLGLSVCLLAPSLLSYGKLPLWLLPSLLLTFQMNSCLLFVPTPFQKNPRLSILRY